MSDPTAQRIGEKAGGKRMLWWVLAVAALLGAAVVLYLLETSDPAPFVYPVY